MNTEQKAIKWVNMVRIIRSLTVDKREPMEIITALLAEHQALLGALKELTGLARGPIGGVSVKMKVDAIAAAEQAIAMCEESNNG